VNRKPSDEQPPPDEDPRLGNRDHHSDQDERRRPQTPQEPRPVDLGIQQATVPGGVHDAADRERETDDTERDSHHGKHPAAETV
jgi:hypothetical protein